MRDPLRLANPVTGEWQLAQAVPRGSDKFVSLKIFSPKSSKAVRIGAGAIAGLDAAGAGAGATVKGLAANVVVWAAVALGIANAAGGMGAVSAGLGAPGGGLGSAPAGGAGAASAPKSTSALLATMAKAAPQADDLRLDNVGGRA